MRCEFKRVTTCCHFLYTDKRPFCHHLGCFYRNYNRIVIKWIHFGSHCLVCTLWLGARRRRSFIFSPLSHLPRRGRFYIAQCGAHRFESDAQSLCIKRKEALQNFARYFFFIPSSSSGSRHEEEKRRVAHAVRVAAIWQHCTMLFSIFPPFWFSARGADPVSGSEMGRNRQ